MKKWDYIIVHHSLTKDNQTVNWDAIRKYHVETLRWADIGYHFGVEDVDGVLKIQFGRSIRQDGAHTLGRNIDSLGVVLVGNYDIEPPSRKKIEKLSELILSLCLLFGINPVNIYPHSHYSVHKSCPGSKFNFPDFKERVIRLFRVINGVNKVI